MADDRARGGGPNAGGPKASWPSAGGSNAGGPDAAGADGPDIDEQLVRVLLQRAVAEVRPDPGGLHRIRRAVPRRRAARRGAWTGAAALAVAVAIALPTLHDNDHLGLSGGPGTPGAQGGSPSVTAAGSPSGSAAVDPNWPPHPGASGTTGSGSPSGSASATPRPEAGSASTGGGAPVPAAASSTGGGSGAPAPLCLRGDLGHGAAKVGAADGDGRIYGYFTLVNVSARTCRLGGPGSVAVTGATGTDTARIRVTDHTAGDPATELPAPRPADVDGPGLLLAPQAAYRVDFGWVPDAGCRAPSGAPPSATTDRSGSGAVGSGTALAGQPGGPGGAATAGAPGAVGPAGGASGAPTAAPPASATPTTDPTSAPSPSATPTAGPSAPPATVTLTHTPAPGSPAAASAVLPGACSGTVYRTAPQPVAGPSAPATPVPSGSPSAD
ncbi:hypothetical protein [Kitasatospora sp. NPDC059327]|uniref:hypothetical protein n=1 Tax=Kitasatospora sp. NPDC059327 TaxID=3346803 RepID=UPI0036CCC077